MQPSEFGGGGGGLISTDVSGDDHLLRDGHGFVDGGVTFLIAFWSVRGMMTNARPQERAADGGPALRSLPLRTMNRGAYAVRVCAAMILLLLDVSINVLSDTVQWRQAFGGVGLPEADPVNADLVTSIVIFAVMVGMRVFFAMAFLLLVVKTAHFRFGRYAELFTDFGGAFLVIVFSLVTTIGTRVIRVVLAAQQVTHPNPNPNPNPNPDPNPRTTLSRRTLTLTLTLSWLRLVMIP